MSIHRTDVEVKYCHLFVDMSYIEKFKKRLEIPLLLWSTICSVGEHSQPCLPLHLVLSYLTTTCTVDAGLKGPFCSWNNSSIHSLICVLILYYLLSISASEYLRYVSFFSTLKPFTCFSSRCSLFLRSLALTTLTSNLQDPSKVVFFSCFMLLRCQSITEFYNILPSLEKIWIWIYYLKFFVQFWFDLFGWLFCLFVVIFPCEYHIDLCIESCFADQLAILHGKTLMLDIIHKLFYQIFSYLPCV